MTIYSQLTPPKSSTDMDNSVAKTTPSTQTHSLRHNSMRKLLGATLAAVTMLTVAVPVSLASQAGHATEVASSLTAATRLNSLLSNVRSMTANFTQTTRGADSGSLGIKNGTFSGRMSVQRPNNFRWETTAPYDQLIIANNDTLWVYDKDLEQATRQTASSQMGNTPALLLSGDPSRIADSFRITQPNSGRNYYVLYPKASDANFESLGVSFSGGKPVMMVLSDSLGQTTSIRFSNVVVNPSVPSSQFVFTPPAGTDVIAQ